MKVQTSTIWESASRPLFVRTVWLESRTYLRPKFQRHFLIDYDLQAALPKLSLKPPNISIKENLSQICSSVNFNDTVLINEEAFHIDSIKAKLHEPTYENRKVLHSERKLSKDFHSVYLQYNHFSRIKNSFKDLASRRSSLQDLKFGKRESEFLEKSTLLNYDECLAERVLNWLDLASRCNSTTTINSDNNNNNKNKNKNKQKIIINQSNNIKKIMKYTDIPISSYHRIDKDKNIVLKNHLIDLRINSSNKNNNQTRKIKDSFINLSSRKRIKRPYTSLHKSNMINQLNSESVNTESVNLSRMKMNRATSSTIGTYRHLETINDLTYSNLEKRLQEPRNSISILESGLNRQSNLNLISNWNLKNRKQLHIFIPSLNKKTNTQFIQTNSVNNMSQLSDYYNGTDKSPSELSHYFTEISENIK